MKVVAAALVAGLVLCPGANAGVIYQEGLPETQGASELTPLEAINQRIRDFGGNPLDMTFDSGEWAVIDASIWCTVGRMCSWDFQRVEAFSFAAVAVPVGIPGTLVLLLSGLMGGGFHGRAARALTGTPVRV
jgi:hypothetical protein